MPMLGVPMLEGLEALEAMMQFLLKLQTGVRSQQDSILEQHQLLFFLKYQ